VPHVLSVSQGRQPMPVRAEVLRDRTIGGEEALHVPGEFEPPDVSFPLAGGLMGVLGAIVQVAMPHTSR
jgi:hypothetical protein